MSNVKSVVAGSLQPPLVTTKTYATAVAAPEPAPRELHKWQVAAHPFKKCLLAFKQLQEIHPPLKFRHLDLFVRADNNCVLQFILKAALLHPFWVSWAEQFVTGGIFNSAQEWERGLLKLRLALALVCRDRVATGVWGAPYCTEQNIDDIATMYTRVDVQLVLDAATILMQEFTGVPVKNQNESASGGGGDT
jgi:hypothetical protein